MRLSAEVTLVGIGGIKRDPKEDKTGRYGARSEFRIEQALCAAQSGCAWRIDLEQLDQSQPVARWGSNIRFSVAGFREFDDRQSAGGLGTPLLSRRCVKPSRPARS